MPKISVILPIYNTEQYLSTCLDSILAQTVKDFEVLAVNNGCTDSCSKILADYAARDNRIRVIERVHGEVSDARNSALEVATGEYLAFCDSDDTLPPNAYATFLKRAEESRSDVVVCGYYNVRDGDKPWPVYLTKREKNSEFALFFVTPCVWHKLIRRSFLESHNLTFPNLVMGEDVVFLGKLLKHNPKIVCTNSLVYYYWHHVRAVTPSMTHRHTLEFFKLHLLCREQLLEEMKGTRFENEAQDYVYLEMIHFLLNFLYKIQNSEERIKAFELFRLHVLKYDWSRREELFEGIIGVDFVQFHTISCEEYIFDSIRFDHRDMVLREFRAGKIGFRYIIRYIKAWAYFKYHRNRIIR